MTIKYAVEISFTILVVHIAGSLRNILQATIDSASTPGESTLEVRKIPQFG